jgi:ribosomal protein S27AE
VFHRGKDVETIRELCPACRSSDLVEGRVQSTGLTYFHPAKTKFWTLTDSYLETKARMCARCGTIVWYADTIKLAALRLPATPQPAEPPTTAPKSDVSSPNPKV